VHGLGFTNIMAIWPEPHKPPLTDGFLMSSDTSHINVRFYDQCLAPIVFDQAMDIDLVLSFRPAPLAPLPHPSNTTIMTGLVANVSNHLS
jgi:hypothetical protein